MNYTQIEALVGVLRESSNLTELEVRQGEVRLRLRRPAPKTSPRPKPVPQPATRISAAATAESPAVPTGPQSQIVTAEFVGIFHANRKHPLSVGDFVQENQVLGQIETMRLLNDCLATGDGRLQAILVMDGQPVEYGQPLFEIVPEETNEPQA